MKHLLIGILFFIATNSLIAQKKMTDVVYLKDGSKIYGIIQVIYPDSVLRIRQADGSQWVFNMKDVSLIDKEEPLKRNAMDFKLKGYNLQVGYGNIFGSGDNEEKAPAGIYLINSLALDSNLSIGLGAGFEFYQQTRLPLFMDIRYYFNARSFRPYVFLQGGIMIPVGKKETTFYNGYQLRGELSQMLNPGFGFLFPVNKDLAIYTSFSYRYQKLKFKGTEYWNHEYTILEKMNRFCLTLGFMLK